MSDSLTDYLTAIRFYERLAHGELYPGTLGEILSEQLARFLRGDVSEQFVIDLATVINREVIHLHPVFEENAVVSACCEIDDLQFMDAKKRTKMAPVALRSAYEILKAGAGNGSS